MAAWRASVSGSGGSARPSRRSGGDRAGSAGTRTPRPMSSSSRATRPPRRGIPVKIGPVVGEHRGRGCPRWRRPGGSMRRRRRALKVTRASDRDGEAGVVIEMVEDLDVGAVGEGPVGGVELPAFVGLVGFEADVGALGPLVRLGGDEPAAGEHPPDRRRRRRAGPSRRSRWNAIVCAPLSWPSSSSSLRSATISFSKASGIRWGLRFGRRDRGVQPGFALGQEPLNEDLHPPPRHPVVPGDLALGAALAHNRRDHQPRHRHEPHPLLRGVHDVSRQL